MNFTNHFRPLSLIFKTVELDDTDTQHQNAVYGKSSKILLSGIIINWIAILFFALSKYQLSVRKEGFQGVICHFELTRILGSRMSLFGAHPLYFLAELSNK